MSEFDEKLNALLSNPDSMAQIMQFAKTLSAQEKTGEAAPQPDPPPSPGQETPASAAMPLDPKLIAKFAPLLKELNGQQNSRARQLLYALRPYLNAQRQEKVERALQLARIIHVGKKFITDWEG